ncbi:MAG TPA: hypothetical protein VFE07_14830 [Marmoricola sp.]|nr:hypothetical protein [Marmoricola sp.]
MLRLRPWHRAALPVVLAAVLTVALTGCGDSGDSKAKAKAERALKDCRAQWSDVGDSVVGMDQDPNPSALAERWNSVIATVDYYKTSKSAKNCQSNVETQLKAVTALRQFSDKLHPYDMAYQLDQVRAAVDLYLNDPLPAPARNENNKLVKPPTKAEVTAAMQSLTANAAAANAELEPGWEQTKSVDLTDVDALTTTMQDLDFLAQDSPHWRTCEQALQVLVAAIRFQEGLVGQPSAPSASPTDATTPAG